MFFGDATKFWDEVVVPTIVPAAYASGDVIGPSIRVPNVSAQSGYPTALVKATVIDASHQNVALTIHLFSAALAVETTDNVAFSIAAADAKKKYLGSFVIPAGTALAAVSLQTYIPAQPFAIKTIDKRSIYAVVVSGGTPTYAGASDLQITLSFAELSR